MKWEKHFVPECYFDTLLVETIFESFGISKNVNHQKSCSKVATVVTKIDDFAVGIVDKDKKTLKVLEEFDNQLHINDLMLWKHKVSNKYIIQLSPAVEAWVLKVVNEAELDLTHLDLSKDLNSLRKFTKHENVNESKKLRDFCSLLVNSGSPSMKTLISWLRYLYENNRNADIKELIKNV